MSRPTLAEQNKMLLHAVELAGAGKLGAVQSLEDAVNHRKALRVLHSVLRHVDEIDESIQGLGLDSSEKSRKKKRAKKKKKTSTKKKKAAAKRLPLANSSSTQEKWITRHQLATRFNILYGKVAFIIRNAPKDSITTKHDKRNGRTITLVLVSTFKKQYDKAASRPRAKKKKKKKKKKTRKKSSKKKAGEKKI